MRKKLLAVLLAASMLLSACGSAKPAGNGDETTASGSAETTVPDVSGMTEEEIYQAMIERSLMTLGDTARMVNVLQKAARGEEITIGYIGGSITEGMTAGAELCWAKLTYDWLCTKFPDAKINYVNAGMSGTPSTLGVIRAERDLYGEFTPDIVFVEFAVNDAQDATSKACYESLVTKILGKENNPAVVLFFTMLKNGYTCEEHMSAVGNNYSLPMISLRNTLQPEFDGGRMAWEDYSDDESHPNVWGHEMVSDLMKNYFEQMIALAAKTPEAPEIAPLNTVPLYSTAYIGEKVIEGTDFVPDDAGSFVYNANVLSQFAGGWEYKGDGNDPMTFKITAKSLFLIFRCNKSAGYGTADVYVDGELVQSVAANRTDGWNNPVAQLIFSDDAAAEHTISIQMQEGSRYYAILAFGYSE